MRVCVYVNINIYTIINENFNIILIDYNYCKIFFYKFFVCRMYIYMCVYVLTTNALIAAAAEVTTTTTTTTAARVRRRERYSARPVDTGAGGHRTTGSRFGCRRLGGPRVRRTARRGGRRCHRRRAAVRAMRASGREGGGPGVTAARIY